TSILLLDAANHTVFYALGSIQRLRGELDLSRSLTIALLASWVGCAPLACAQRAHISPEPPASSAAKPGSSGAPPRDLNGVWMETGNEITFSPIEPPLQPWARENFEAAKPGYGPRASADSRDPILQCLPPGVPRIMLFAFPLQIVQVPGQIIMI